jgi:hypothetical protein
VITVGASLFACRKTVATGDWRAVFLYRLLGLYFSGDSYCYRLVFASLVADINAPAYAEHGAVEYLAMTSIGGIRSEQMNQTKSQRQDVCYSYP